MPKSDRSGDFQYAALPYRFDKRAGLMILFLTSRERGRWIIPKGWPMRGKKAHKVAEIEAFQEAGVIGKALRASIGSYVYLKDLPDRSQRSLTVEVYPMRVARELQNWPEAAERARVWFPLTAAISLISDDGLVPILNSLRGLTTIPGTRRGAADAVQKEPLRSASR